MSKHQRAPGGRNTIAARIRVTISFCRPHPVSLSPIPFSHSLSLSFFSFLSFSLSLFLFLLLSLSLPLSLSLSLSLSLFLCPFFRCRRRPKTLLASWHNDPEFNFKSSHVWQVTRVTPIVNNRASFVWSQKSQAPSVLPHTEAYLLRSNAAW